MDTEYSVSIILFPKRMEKMVLCDIFARSLTPIFLGEVREI
jgi:hypothetical protein